MRRRRDNVVSFRKPKRRNARAAGSTWSGAFRSVRPWLLLIALVAIVFVVREFARGGDFENAQILSLTFPFCSAPGYSPNCVVDGDTIRIGERRIRLTDFDAPEIHGQCLAESDAAQRAKAELARWLSSAPFQLDGGDDPPRDRYGRELRAARRLSPTGEMQLLSDHMIGAGLAEGDYWDAGWSDDWGIGRQRWC